MCPGTHAPSARGLLWLEDGSVFEGRRVGAAETVCGESVFTTAMTGYQQLVSDPSFREQIVCMTAPMIGNHGVDDRLMESPAPQVAGLVMRCADDSWSAWLHRHGVPALTDVDTRRLALHLRTRGVMRAAITDDSCDREQALSRVRVTPSMHGRALVAGVSTPQRWVYAAEGRVDIAVVDFGVRRSLLRELSSAGAVVTVYPHDVDARTLLAHDAVVLSSGPGDPAALTDEIATIVALLGHRPILGICLGHQLLALALGERTYKLPFGHRGANHPVLDRASNTVMITSQNHGFGTEVVDERIVTHHSLYDQTVEGLARPDLRASSVQFHPEAGPGPGDTRHMLARWVDEVADAS